MKPASTSIGHPQMAQKVLVHSSEMAHANMHQMQQMSPYHHPSTSASAVYANNERGKSNRYDRATHASPSKR